MRQLSACSLGAHDVLKQIRASVWTWVRASVNARTAGWGCVRNESDLDNCICSLHIWEKPELEQQMTEVCGVSLW